MSLVARHLEAAGIPTIVAGCARDIVEQCGVPRFLFSDFPLGNPVGRPHDRAMQRAVVGLALDVLETACAPRTTVQTPYVWDGDPSWRQRFMQLDPAGQPVRDATAPYTGSVPEPADARRQD